MPSELEIKSIVFGLCVSVSGCMQQTLMLAITFGNCVKLFFNVGHNFWKLCCIVVFLVYIPINFNDILVR